jgi:hypothetical protein
MPDEDSLYFNFFQISSGQSRARWRGVAHRQNHASTRITGWLGGDDMWQNGINEEF